MASRLFANVVVLTPITAPRPGAAEQSFTYDVPDVLRGELADGSLVVVPFGSRRLYGIVAGLSDTSPVPETRSVESLVDADPVITATQLELARWMSREYMAPLWRCLTLMLPPGLVGQTDVQIELADEVEPGVGTKPGHPSPNTHSSRLWISLVATESFPYRCVASAWLISSLPFPISTSEISMCRLPRLVE